MKKWAAKSLPIFYSGVFKSLCRGILDFSQVSPYNDSMNTMIKSALTDSMRGFHLPRYAELPDMGLYLEQTTKYINQCLKPLGCAELTSSMIRNYVKQGLVINPVHKQYYADQIAHLICITLLKQVTPLEYIDKLFSRQRKVYTDQVAYDYFCTELENILYFRFDLKDSVENIGLTSSIEKEMLRSAITAVSHVIYLNACFQYLSQEE